MKIFVIADPDTLLVYTLAGLEGVALSSPDDTPEVLNRMNRETVGLILITERLALPHRNVIEEMMIHSDKPLVVEIPDMKGPLPKFAGGAERLISLIRS